MFLITRITKDPEIRQAELIDAAQELFITAGYQQTNISDIVKKVGVSQGTFYYYFPSKEAVLEAIFTRHAKAWVSEVQLAAPEKVLEQLQLFINRFYQFCYYDETALITKILYKEKQGELINKLWRQVQLLATPLLRRILEQGNQEGLTKVEHMDETLSFFAGIIAALLEASSPSEYGHETDSALLKNKMIIAEKLLETLLGTPSGSIHLDCFTP